MHSWRPSILVDFLRRRVYLIRGTNVAGEIRAIFHFRAPLNKCAGSSREGEREREEKREVIVEHLVTFVDLLSKFSDQFMGRERTRIMKLL